MTEIIELHPVIEEALKPFSPKTTLRDLLYSLENIEHVIDNAEEITVEMITEHFEAVKAVDKKTDALITAKERIEMELYQAISKRDAYKHKTKILENNLIRIKDYTKWVLVNNPNLSFRGTRGKIALQKGAKKLQMLTEEKSYSNDHVIPEEILLNIPPEFRNLKPVWYYDRDAIRKALDEGRPCEVAEYVETSYARFRIWSRGRLNAHSGKELY